MTENEALAKAAGIIEGEGCIQIAKSGRVGYRKNPAYTIRVVVTNANPHMIIFMEEHFKGNTLILKGQKEHYKRCFQWYLCGNDAKDFLVKVMPFLDCKADEAGLAIRLQEENNKEHPETSPYRWQIKEGLFQTSKWLKQRGW